MTFQLKIRRVVIFSVQSQTWCNFLSSEHDALKIIYFKIWHNFYFSFQSLKEGKFFPSISDTTKFWISKSRFLKKNYICKSCPFYGVERDKTWIFEGKVFWKNQNRCKFLNSKSIWRVVKFSIRNVWSCMSF